MLYKSERSIRREINRGLVKVLNYDLTDKYEYSARIAQRKYEYDMTSIGPGLKLDQNHK